MDTLVNKHPNPAWKEIGNSLITLSITPPGHSSVIEELFCHQLGDKLYKLCCIPFYAYRIALGDEFEVEADLKSGEGLYIINQVKKSLGHSTFRAWFGGTGNPSTKTEVYQEIEKLGCLMEWHPSELLAIDAETKIQAKEVFKLLHLREQKGELKYEVAQHDTLHHVAFHNNPVWSKKANFVINARLDSKESDSSLKWEQLWVRNLGENLYEVCCIPFFVYNLALGDEVETILSIDDLQSNIFHKIYKASGHYTFRIWFGEVPTSQTKEEIYSELLNLNCLAEWYSPDLLALDAESESHAQVVANLLDHKEKLGLLVYETGRL